MAKSTRSKSAISYKETAFGIIPRSKLEDLLANALKESLEKV